MGDLHYQHHSNLRLSDESGNVMHIKKEGFVLVLTLMVISILVVLVTQFFQEGQLQLFFDTTITQREQAKQLALSGLSLAISTLDPQIQAQKNKKKETAGKTEPTNAQKKCSDLLVHLLPLLNRWQTISFSEEKDGLEGTISLCITCEDGKLDLTQLYDAHQKKFFGENVLTGPDAKKGLKALFGMIRPLVGNRDLFEPLSTWLKQRSYRLVDVTELLTEKEFQVSFGAHVFKKPPFLAPNQSSHLILTDLFTMYGNRQPNVWFLSDSLCAALGLKRPSTQSTEELQQALNEIDCGTDVQQVLQHLYGKDIKALPQDFAPFIGINQNSAMFGVTSYGIIGTLVQGVYAIIQRTNERCRVIKLYWI
jgi:hypothetical protein